MSPYDHLIGRELVSGSWSWDADRAMLYAVGVGAGADDPLDELEYTTENTPSAAQRVLPSFLTIMGIRSDWAAQLGWRGEGLTPVGIVHGEQSVTLARPIPTSGTVRLSKVLRGVHDKGSGALIVADAADGAVIGSARMSVFAQGKGGFDGGRQPKASTWRCPDTSPDAELRVSVGLNQSLIYRLLGDRNLHGTDPVRARADGFDRPIFYGLGTFGYACRALMKALCGGDPSRFGHMEGRFSKPVYPGDVLHARI